MSNSKGFFAQFAAALQFPLYFGKNMNALAECLRDLEEWLPGDAYTLVISQTMSVLRDERPEDLEAFIRLLSEVSSEWAVGTLPGANWERKPTPFHVAFHVSTEEVDALRTVLVPLVGNMPAIDLAEDNPF
jgi:RNAse (barnase) inhibitor barstar